MSDEQRQYISYLLRLWQEPVTVRTVWRASLENPQTGELMGFGEVSQLFAFLERQIAEPDLNCKLIVSSRNSQRSTRGTSIVPERDAASTERAAQLVKDGDCVASFVRSVWVLWIDAANSHAIETIYRIKGNKRIGRPISTTLDAERFVEMLDADRIAPGVRGIFLDPQELERRLGMLCLIRAPIKKSAAQALPPDILSQRADGTNWLQNCVVTGSGPVITLIQTIRNKGVEFPAVTSMNVSGQPEIVERGAAERFCREHHVPLVLANQEDRRIVRGSFPIIEVGDAGVKLVREGHFPGYLFRYLLDGAEVDLSGALPSKFPIVITHSEQVAARTNPGRLREEIIARLEGGE